MKKSAHRKTVYGRGVWRCRPVTAVPVLCGGGASRLQFIDQRSSADSFLGLPYNTASLAVLTMMLAQQCDLEPGEIIICTGDSHIYSNHLEQVREQLSREPGPCPG